MNKFYAAKDIYGISFFSDCPDLVKYTKDSEAEWAGYPMDLDENQKDILLANQKIINMPNYSRVEIEITEDQTFIKFI